jgi:hypothetical protein
MKSRSNNTTEANLIELLSARSKLASEAAVGLRWHAKCIYSITVLVFCRFLSARIYGSQDSARSEVVIFYAFFTDVYR